MKFNHATFWKVFLTLTALEACLFLTGCTSAWLTTISGLLPTIAAIANSILAFVTALEGKTIPAGTTAAIQKWQQNVASEIANAQAVIASLKQAASSSLIAQLQAVMNGISQSFSSILAGVNVTDSATVAKLTQFFSLGVAAVNAVLAFIPLAASKIGAPEEELKHYDAVAAKATASAANVIKETYVAIVEQHTPNADVNSALDALPRTI